MWDDYGIEAANWYENNPNLPGSSNPHIPAGANLPLELALFGFGGGRGGKPIDPAVYGGPRGGLGREVEKFNKMSPGMFHIIDGQHRLFGYSPLFEDDEEDVVVVVVVVVVAAILLLLLLLFTLDDEDDDEEDELFGFIIIMLLLLLFIRITFVPK